MLDYTHHLPKNFDWMNEYGQSKGVVVLADYLKSVRAMLNKLEAGKYFSIENYVKEENRDLFIKCCCYIISYDFNGSQFEFNNTATKVRRIP